jgi:hypothetical protein
MECTKHADPYLLGRQYCGGKLSTDTVTVSIIPANEKVETVVVSHFKSQILPPLMRAPQQPMR